MSKTRAVAEATATEQPERAAEWVPRATLTLFAQNPRNNEPAIPVVASSIRRFGWGAPLVVRTSTRMVLAGHTRLGAAALLATQYEAATTRERKNWHPEAVRVATTGDVPARFVDLDEHDAKLYAIADNMIGETFSTFDDDKLAEILTELREAGVDDLVDGTGLTTAELHKLLDEDTDAGAGIDPGATDPPAVPVSVRGEVYELGPHRLMCGDSTSAADIAKLLGGEVAALLSTDPPYCVDYTGNDRPIHDGKPSGKDWSHVYREVDIKDLGEFLDGVLSAALPHVRQNAAVYMWHAHLQQPVIASTFEKHGILLHQVLIWVKPVATFGHSFYRWRHEPCAFGWRRGHKPAHGFGADDSVWEVDWEGKGRLVGNEHPTQKPLELFARPIRTHTEKGDVVLEPFGGSGSQLIAAAQERRRCFAMEISPAFVDVIRRRWTGYARSAGIPPGAGALE